MAVELGQLLGQYGGGQSFEHVSSWFDNTAQCSFSLQTTEVHSSAQGAQIEVYSGGTGSLEYAHEQTNDLVTRWSPDVTTHRVVSYSWARIDTAVNSGNVIAIWSGGSVAIPHDNDLQRIRLETNITSDDANQFDFQIAILNSGSYSVYIDDVLTAVDVINFEVDWSYRNLRELGIVKHDTISGRETYYSWGEFGKWRLPLSLLPDQEASFINLWWRDARPLMFTMDTSDSENIYVARIVNQGAPLSQYHRPYNDLWRGVLELEAIHDSLDF